MLKSGRHHLEHSYWSLWRQLGWRKSLLLIWKFGKVFVNALTARDKYSLRNRNNLTQPIQRQLSQKQETLWKFFYWIFEIYFEFWTFSKKWRLSSLIDFGNYGLRKTCLNKCLKNPVSEDSLASSMVNGNKHCWNLDSTTFSIVIDDSEHNCIRKNLITDMQCLKSVC